MNAEKEILARLRKICLALPDAKETLIWDHPHFRVDKKIFASFSEYKSEWGISLKVGKLMQGVFLDDPRFFRAPYVGKYGWVTLRLDAAPLHWPEIRGLVKESYRLVAPLAKKKRRRRVARQSEKERRPGNRP